MNLWASHYVLAVAPLWLTAAVLYFFTIAVLYLGRAVFEGMSYNVALSSKFGDVGLIMIVLIGATILQRDGLYLPHWASGAGSHGALAFCAAAIGITIFIVVWSEQVMDNYHHMIIVPLFLYLLASVAPVIYLNGTRLEQWGSMVLLAIWLALLGLDAYTGRLEQRAWLESRGVTFDKK
ncbi:MAG: hypothetical protein AAB449_01335 [Patescibacteria group bacterium]